MNEIIGATGAGCASTLIGHPLDTLKVHLQAEISERSTSDKNTRRHLLASKGKNHKTALNTGSTWKTAKNLIRIGGGSPSVFFRGIGPPMCNAILMNTVMFSVFDHMKKANKDEEGNSIMGTTGKAFFAGILSGFATACISTPTDYVKIQSQLKGTNTKEVLSKIVNSNSNPIAIIYRGHLANLGREGVFTMVYLGLYDCLRIYNQEQFHRDLSISNHPSFTWVAATSSLTGGLAWVVSYPFDTIKTFTQASEAKLSIRQVFQRIYWRSGQQQQQQQGDSRGGYRAFYRGCGASTGRAMLVTSTRMVVYEWILKFLVSNRQ